MIEQEFSTTLRPGSPDFHDLPWHHPIETWVDHCNRLEELPRGPSRHPVVFINYSGALYAVKELPAGLAHKEYDLLCRMEEARLPVVTPVGYVQFQRPTGVAGALITRYLECSLPYRHIFMSSSLMRYREHLLDAMAGLLVQLHLADVYWGDCSLANTLFRRDAGALRAYLVDAETAALYPQNFPTAMRVHELEIMEENIEGDVADLRLAHELAQGIPIIDTGIYIRQRYRQLWNEITREDIINPGENFRIQERIRALNELGFSVGEVELADTRGGNQLRFRVVVTDRNFHHHQLQGMTGIDAEEQQARQIMNEIQQLKATLSRSSNRSVSLSAAAYHWLENYYQPTMRRLETLIGKQGTAPEIYCQVLEHKWFLSEKVQRDVGHSHATEDYQQQFGSYSGSEF